MIVYSDLIEQHPITAEVLAAVVYHLFPNVVLAGGGVYSLGFYYDFIFEKPLIKSMLELIEVNLHRFIKEDHPVRSITMMRENARALFEHHGHFLLARQVDEQDLNILELVQIESFYGLCPSSSLTTTQEIGYIKLLECVELTSGIQGERIKVTRILGVSHKHAKSLKKFLKTYDVFLKKQDHRLLGSKLNLFSFPTSGAALGVIWHPKGVQLQNILLNWLKEQVPGRKREVSTPFIIQDNFFKPKAHNLASFTFEGKNYHLRSSLLHQHLEFLSRFSLENEELPWQMTECASLFRKYPESQQWGLFCQDTYLTEQTTICCFKDQVISELISSLHFIEQIITIFDLEARWYLITSRQKNSKSRKEQQVINEWLQEAIQSLACSYRMSLGLEEEEIPRLELRVLDVLGREWPISYLSIVYPGQDAFSWVVQSEKEQKRVIITRCICESVDRFIALLVEHYEGVLPFWLAPEQVRVMVIGSINLPYAQQVTQRLQYQGIRVKLDSRQAKLGLRIHEAEKESVPYLVLIGEQERMKQTISIRAAKEFGQIQANDVETFLKNIHQKSLYPVFVKRG